MRSAPPGDDVGVRLGPPADPSPLALDAPREEILGHAARLLAESWKSFDCFRPAEPPIDEHVRALLSRPLPEAPSGSADALADAARVLDESVAQPRPRYFAFVGSSGLEIGVVADALAACYDVNLAVEAGAASEIERQAIRWAGEFIGYPAAAGSFTSGGTVSNITALAAARERALPGARRTGLSGLRPALYCSAEAHYSVTRSAELLGIGGDGIRAIPIDGRRRMRPDALRDALRRDRRAGVAPVAVVATAGTTLTGAVDPLADVADVCAEAGVWMHVDGAYGAPAASLPELAGQFAGLDRADSVALDGHKWLYLPKSCGVVLVRDRADLEAAFSHDEGYLPHERREPHAVDITLEYSRPFRALKLWLAFRVHGADAFRRAIRRNLRQARLLHGLVLADPRLAALAPPELSIVPFRHLPRAGDPDVHNRALGEALRADGRAYVSWAVIDGHVHLRPCIVNYRTTDEDVEALVAIAHDVAGRLPAG